MAITPRLAGGPMQFVIDSLAELDDLSGFTGGSWCWSWRPATCGSVIRAALV
jgi:hypothetical protein